MPGLRCFVPIVGVFFFSSGLLFVSVLCVLVGQFNRVEPQLIGLGNFFVGPLSERASFE